MKSSIKYAMIAAAAIFCIASCTTENNKDYINLSVEAYTFSYTGEDSITVTVNTNAGEWTATTNNDFIQIGEKTDNSVVISVLPNTTDEQLSGTVNFTAGTATATFIVTQLESMFRSSYRQFDNKSIGVMSRNGRYYAYVTVYSPDGTNFDDQCYIVDFLTGEETEFALEEPGQGVGYYDSVQAISDDGKTLILGNTLAVLTELYVNGERIPVSCEPGYSNPYLQNMSADGSVIVGAVTDDNADFYFVAPSVWINGEQTILSTPEYNALGQELACGVYLRGCSDDGSIIFGSEWDTYGLVYYKNDRMYNIGVENSEVSGNEVVTIPYLEASFFNISPNGKYIVCNYRKNGAEYPFRVNTETGQFSYLSAGSGCAAATVDDNGLVFGYTPVMNAMSGVVLDFDAQTQESLSDWMQRVKGIEITNDRWINQISTNGKAMAGVDVDVTPLGIQNRCWYCVVE